jgi:hypothetical protein
LRTSEPDILRVVPSSDLRRGLRVGLQLRKVWEKALGQPLATELTPGPLERGRLTVFTARSTWLMEARFLEARLRTALQAELPDLGIERIEIRMGKRTAPEGRTETSKAKPEPRPFLANDEERARVREIVREVGDPDLRESLARLLEKAAARKRRLEEARRDGE